MDQSIHDVRRSNWLNIVNECQQMPANMTVKQWLADNGIKEKSYYYWLQKSRKEAYGQMRMPPAASSSEITFTEIPVPLNKQEELLHPLLAAFLWACYSILTRKISSFGYNTILTTRRVFFYGILFMIPALFLFDFELDLSRFANMTYLLNILFLGLGASALCFVTWNFAVKILGAVKTSICIYLVPVITVAASVLIIHEPFTWITGIGTILTLAGLLISEKKHIRKEVESNGFTE